LEYLIDFTIDIPDGTPATDVDQRAQAEADRVGVLATEGHVLRVWRPTPDDGSWRAISLYRAGDEAELNAILKSLPLYPWMKISVRALAPHPNDPGAVSA
jgi:muconolactone D-isomerase